MSIDCRPRHKVKYQRLDGTMQTVTIIGATDEELRDEEFVLGLLDQHCTPDVRGECVITLRPKGD